MSHNISISITPSPITPESEAAAREVSIGILEFLGSTPGLKENSYKVRTAGPGNISMEEAKATPSNWLTLADILDFLEKEPATDDVRELLKLYRSPNLVDFMRGEESEYVKNVLGLMGTYEGSRHMSIIRLGDQDYTTYDKELFDAARMSRDEIAATTNKIGEVSPILNARARQITFNNCKQPMSSF